MKFGRAEPETEQGEWVKHYQEQPLRPGEEEPRKVFTGMELKIRRIPSARRLAIARQHGMGSRKVRVFRNGDSEITRDVEKETAIGVAQAVFALVDSRECQVELLDEASAKVYARLLNDASLKKGDVVTLDGRWTKELREDFLSEYVEVAAWIVSRADEIGQVAAEEEQGKGTTSSTTPSSV